MSESVVTVGRRARIQKSRRAGIIQRTVRCGSPQVRTIHLNVALRRPCGSTSLGLRQSIIGLHSETAAVMAPSGGTLASKSRVSFSFGFDKG
jgi:hypothetical protein